MYPFLYIGSEPSVLLRTDDIRFVYRESELYRKKDSICSEQVLSFCVGKMGEEAFLTSGMSKMPDAVGN